MESLFQFKLQKDGKQGRDKMVRAVKDYPHKCERCGGDIKKGELYLTATEYRTLNFCYPQIYTNHRLCEDCVEKLLEIKEVEAKKENNISEWVDDLAGIGIFATDIVLSAEQDSARTILVRGMLK